MSSTRGLRNRSTPPAFSSGVTSFLPRSALRGAGFPAVVPLPRASARFYRCGPVVDLDDLGGLHRVAHLYRSALRFRCVRGKSTLDLFARLPDRLGLVCVASSVRGASRPGRRAPSSRSWCGCARKHANLPSSIAFETDEPFALKHAQKLHDRGTPHLRSSKVPSTARTNCFHCRTYIGQRGGCAARPNTSRV